MQNVPLLFMLLSLLGGVGQASADDSPKQMIAELSSPEISPAQMEDIEATLKEMEPEKVVPLLLPKIVQGMPSGIIYNGSGSAKGDANAPPEWRAFYSYHRVWREVAGKVPEFTGKLLAKRLASTKLPSEQGVLISELETYWNPAAEDSIAAILRKFRDEKSPWLQAVRCLMRHKSEKYYDDVKQLAQQLPVMKWQQLNRKASVIDLLLSRRTAALGRNKSGLSLKALVPPVDAELLPIAFDTLKRMEEHDEGFGYFLALELADYLERDFKPDQSDPEYQKDDGSGLTDGFFADTSQNALDWWRQNKEEYIQTR